MQLGIARNIQQCHSALLEHLQLQPQGLTAHFLIAQPMFKGAVRRLQGMAKTNYGEIRANLLARDMLPIHLLRCKLAFFGAGNSTPSQAAGCVSRCSRARRWSATSVSRSQTTGISQSCRKGSFDHARIA